MVLLVTDGSVVVVTKVITGIPLSRLGSSGCAAPDAGGGIGARLPAAVVVGPAGLAVVAVDGGAVVVVVDDFGGTVWGGVVVVGEAVVDVVDDGGVWASTAAVPARTTNASAPTRIKRKRRTAPS